MALNEHKIINLSNPIISLPDHPSAENMTAAEIKAAFDKSPNEIKDKINALIDNLLSITNGDSGADNIGSTAITGVSGKTVQAQLESLKALLDATVIEQIPDGSITDDKLSNAVGQVKERINTLADQVGGSMTTAGGTFTGIVTAHSNTSYTVRQMRNIILSTADADVLAMQDGDIWIKYV